MKRIGITGPTGAGKTTALQALAELDAHIIDADAVYHALLESSATLRAELTARFGPSILDGEGRVNRKALGGVVFGDPAALAELNVLESSATLRAELTARFGPSILDGEGRVNRKALGGVVFGDPAALAELNAITHRFILAEIDRQAAGAEEQGRSAVAIDAIALIESGLGETCGAIVGILAPRELRIRRIMAREGISEDYARKRVIDAIALIESGLGETCGAIVGILAPRELRIRRIMAREGISEDYARKRVEAQQGDGFFRTHCDYLLENRADDTPEAFQARAKQLFEQILSNRN